MKGVILAGGKGSRLRPLTDTVNKLLLPIYDKPMIFYPILAMRNAGITEICIVVNRAGGDILLALGDGSRLGVKLTYVVQEEARGIGHALLQARKFVGISDFALVLGDNLFDEQDLIDGIVQFKRKNINGLLYLKEVDNPERFGVAKLSEDGKTVVDLVEKPKSFISNLAVTGIYLYRPLYEPDVFKIAEKTEPSKRGEVEITDINRTLMEKGKVEFHQMQGHYLDTGTFESLAEAILMEKERGRPYDKYSR